MVCSQIVFKDEEEQIDSIYCADEMEIYRYLDLSFITPELREGLGEINAAKDKKLPNLIEISDLEGLFHIHSNYSDGVNSLREMVEGAIERGYQYIGISDHSQTAVYTGGLTKETFLKQFEEIEELNLEYSNFKIFKGIEADILPSGDLDYDYEFLANLISLLVPFTLIFRMFKDEMTKRILKAMENPFLTILGHLTGRILLERPGYEIDLDTVVNKAVSSGVILEFNANPYRLDLDWRFCRKVKELGGLIAINPDAHSVSEFDLVIGGLEIARKGWLECEEVFNTKGILEIEDFLARRKYHLIC